MVHDIWIPHPDEMIIPLFVMLSNQSIFQCPALLRSEYARAGFSHLKAERRLTDCLMEPKSARR